MNNICPNCSIDLEKRPSRKSKCPSCTKYIYVRDGELKTLKESIFIDSVKRIQDQNLFDTSGVANVDELWGLLNEKVLEHSAKGKFDSLATLYLEMAQITFAEEKFKHCVTFYMLCSHFAAFNTALVDKEMGIAITLLDLLATDNYMITSPVRKSLEKLKLPNMEAKKLGKLAVTQSLTLSQKEKILEEVLQNDNRRLDRLNASLKEEDVIVSKAPVEPVSPTSKDLTQTICPKCEATLKINGAGNYNCPDCNERIEIHDEQTKPQVNKKKGIKCPKCHGSNTVVHTENEMEVKHRGCMSWLLWIVLAILTLGLILIIPLVTNSKIKSKNKTVGVCQDCGKKWDIK